MMQTNGKLMHYSNRHQHSRSRSSTGYADGLSRSASGSCSIFVSGRSLQPEEYAHKDIPALRYPSKRWWHIARKRPASSASLSQTLEIWGLTVCRRSPLDQLLLPGIRPHAARFYQPINLFEGC